MVDKRVDTAFDPVDAVYRAAKYQIWYKDPAVFFKDIFNLEPYPYQKNILRALPSEPKRMIMMAAGGTGKTKMLACIALWLTVVYPKFIKRPYTVIIISGSDEQARYLYEYCKYAIQDTKILSEEVDGDPLQSLTKFKDRSLIRAVPNSLKAIQGKHEDCVIVDEGALAGDFVIQDTLRIVSTTDKDLIILSGTPTVYATHFVEIWEQPEKHTEWKRFHWSAKDCPSISAEKIEEAKKLPEDMWVRFWEGNPFAGGDTLIPITEIKDATKDTPHFQIDPSVEVIAGVDWGWQHYTAITVLQRGKDGIFRILYQDAWRREDFEDMGTKLAYICSEYKVSKIYADSEDIGENQRLESKGFILEPIKFNEWKVQMQSHMKIVFHQRMIKIPIDYQMLIQELRRYKWNTKEGDDSVTSLFLALWGAKAELNGFYYEII